MGGNSSTAAIGTGLPGVPGAAMQPGAIEALAAELQAKSSAGAGREPIRGQGRGHVAKKSDPAKVSPRAAVDREPPLREADMFLPVFGGADAPAMLATNTGSGPWWAGSFDGPPAMTSDEVADRMKRASRAYGHAADTIVRGAADFYSIGLADEVAAGIDTLTGSGVAPYYDGNLRAQRARDLYDEANFPVSRLAGQVGAGLTLARSPLGLLAAVPGTGQKMFIGGVTGAAASGAYGFGSGEGGLQNRLEKAREEARLGATLGAAFPVVGDVASKGYRAVADRLRKGALDEAPPAADKIATAKASRIHTYDGPDLRTPFEVDYPNAVPHDPHTGRLLTDMEGQPLIAQTIAGRNTKDGPNIALSPDQIREIGKRIGVTYEEVEPHEIPGYAGLVAIDTDQAGDLVRAAAKIDKTLDADDFANAFAHETSHVIDIIARQIPIDGIEDELRFVYSVQRKGYGWGEPLGPEDFGYRPDQLREELIAEGLRAYLRTPDWFKSVAPNTAKRFRAMINSNPKINPYLQLNSLVPAGGAGIGVGAMFGSKDERREPRRP
jgi:hypothetical protein